MKDKDMVVVLEREVEELKGQLELANDLKRGETLDALVARSEAGKLGRIIHRQRLAIKKLKELLSKEQLAAAEAEARLTGPLISDENIKKFSA